MSPHPQPSGSELPARLLLYGRDAALLGTRRMVLEKVGFQVWTATLLSEVRNTLATEQIDLIILGHTLSIEQSEEALAAAQPYGSALKIFILAEDRSVWDRVDHHEVLGPFDPFEGPDALIAAVKRALILQETKEMLERL